MCLFCGLPAAGGAVVVVIVVVVVDVVVVAVGHGPKHRSPMCFVIISRPYVHVLFWYRHPFTPHFASHGPNCDHAVHSLSENGTMINVRVELPYSATPTVCINTLTLRQCNCIPSRVASLLVHLHHRDDLDSDLQRSNGDVARKMAIVIMMVLVGDTATYFSVDCMVDVLS